MKALAVLGAGLAVVFLWIHYRYRYLWAGIRKVYLKGHVTSFIEDASQHPHRPLPAEHPLPWPEAKGQQPPSADAEVEALHRRFHTVAFLVFKDGRLIHEDYREGFDARSLSNGFSMTKSVVMLLAAKAVEEGYIPSLDEPLRTYLPGIRGPYAGQVTLRHLAMMAGGTNWDESYYNPFGLTARSYFTRDLEKMMLRHVRFVRPPGRHWQYASGDTQFLGLAVQKAVGRPLTEYLHEKFWLLLGMERDGFWSLDRPGGNEKAFCCLHATARDFARFTALMLNGGQWNGRRLIDRQWVEQMTRPAMEGVPYYGLHWWLFSHKGWRGYTMRGHLGQYVMAVPSEKVIIVRLGRGKPPNEPGTFAYDFYAYLERGMQIAAQKGQP